MNTKAYTNKSNTNLNNIPWRQEFHEKILTSLGEIREISKQSSGNDTRKQLEEHLQQLAELGKPRKIQSWIELVSTAATAIANPKNPYRPSVKLMIKEIKQAGELVRAGRLDEIRVSDQLQELSPRSPALEVKVPEAKGTDDFLEEEAGAERSSEVEKASWEDNSDSLKQETAKDTLILFGEGFSFEESETAEVVTTSDLESDLNNLFTEDFSFEEELVLDEEREELNQDLALDDLLGPDSSAQKEKVTKSKSSKSVVNKDTQVLFGESFSFQEIGEPVSDHKSTEVEEDLELTDLFTEETTSVAEEDLDIDDLFEELTAPPKGEEISSEAALTLLVYEQFAELDDLIDQLPDPKWSEKDYQQLEAEIDSPAQSNIDLTSTAINLGREGEKGNIAKPTAANLVVTDPEFGDLEELLEEANLTMGVPAAVKAAEPRSKRPRLLKSKGFEQTMRVPVKQLDNLNNWMGELVVNRNSLEQDQKRLRQFLDNLLIQVQNLSDLGARMQDLYERSLLEKALLASSNKFQPKEKQRLSSQTKFSGDDYDPLEMDRFSNFHLLSQEMIELIVRVKEASEDIEFLVDKTEQVARNFRQLTTQLQEELTNARMVPFGQTGNRLRRAVREISLKLNKQAELHVEGRDVLVDKMILESLYDPMTQLVNNAIIHGIEIPERREQRGKPSKGNVTIKAFIQGNQTVISVSDDGEGINKDKVKSKAMEKRLITKEEAENMSPHQVYDLIFHPGFTTKDEADQFAGRGVGMDLVLTSLSAIRGTISIDSEMGYGTTFTIRLPLTLSICKVLCCVSDQARIAFPLDRVEDMQEYSPHEIIENSKGEKCIPWRNQTLPFHPLTNLLTYNRKINRGTVYGAQREEEMVSIVVLRSAGTYLAVQLDKIEGEQEIVIKQIEGPIPKPAGIAGATILVDGRVMPIADVLELIEIAQGGMRKDFAPFELQRNLYGVQSELIPTKTESMVLIVDDSITVRELLTMTFTKAGYRVETARDGQEAWNKLRSGLPCDIVLCDIEMPRMDGLELLSRIREDDTHSLLPVAMLTSRGAERHQQMAAKLGASGYFTKPYLEEVLLDDARRMMKGEVLLPESIRKSVESEPEEPEIIEPPKRTTSEPILGVRKVLIIDDSVTVRELLSMTFNGAGYVVEQARDGEDAWKKLNSARYDVNVIFCDIEMPRLNGLDLLSRLQQDPQLSQIPVAMLTSRGAQRHRSIAAERGAKAYFTKPYVENVLLNAADRLIQGEVLEDTLTKMDPRAGKDLQQSIK